MMAECRSTDAARAQRNDSGGTPKALSSYNKAREAAARRGRSCAPGAVSVAQGWAQAPRYVALGTATHADKRGSAGDKQDQRQAGRQGARLRAYSEMSKPNRGGCTGADYKNPGCVKLVYPPKGFNLV
jgi:hypothetical protein